MEGERGAVVQILSGRSAEGAGDVEPVGWRIHESEGRD